jgi:hypothetical protein
MKSTTETRLKGYASRLAWGWLGAWAVMGLAASCRPDLSLGEVDAGAGGEASEVVGGSGGNGGTAGTVAKAGKGGAPASAGSSGKSGSSGSGGTAGAGAVGVGGSVSAGGGSSSGGTEDMGGAPGTGGMASSSGGMALVAEGGSPGEGGSGGTSPSPSQAQIEEQTILRWNAVADHRPPNEYEFHWEKDFFPHPTFKGGYPEGYLEFALVLDVFLTEHFDFLAEYHQFLTPYYYVTESPVDEDLVGTWDSLTTDFSSDNYADFADIPADVQGRLAEFAADMKQYE